MKNKYLTSFTALLLSSSLLFSVCSSIRASSDTNTAFRQFTLELFRQDVAANTIGLHYTLKDPSAYDIVQAPITPPGSFSTNTTGMMASLKTVFLLCPIITMKISQTKINSPTIFSNLICRLPKKALPISYTRNH